MKITKISKKKFNGKVYNFHCLPDENYFSEYVLVHNCYKSNTCRGKEMSFEVFRQILDCVKRNNPVLTQIAFGIGDVDANKDLFRIFDYCRENAVVPNLTISGDRLSDDIVLQLVQKVGALAVSHYEPEEVCFNAIQRLDDTRKSTSGATLKQINIHKLLSEETYSECVSLIQRKAEGKLPSGLNAIVFLCLKQCGRGTSMTPLKDMKKYKALIDLALDKKVSIGFDSCGCAAFETAIQGRKDEALLRAASDKCESGLFSFYCNVEGIASPCSFCEKVDGVPHIDLLSCKDFQKEVWYSEEVIEWRARLLSNERKCPVYDLEMLE